VPFSHLFVPHPPKSRPKPRPKPRPTPEPRIMTSSSNVIHVNPPHKLLLPSIHHPPHVVAAQLDLFAGVPQRDKHGVGGGSGGTQLRHCVAPPLEPVVCGFGGLVGGWLGDGVGWVLGGVCACVWEGGVEQAGRLMWFKFDQWCKHSSAAPHPPRRSKQDQIRSSTIAAARPRAPDGRYRKLPAAHVLPYQQRLQVEGPERQHPRPECPGEVARPGEALRVVLRHLSSCGVWL